ncbi:MAG: DUF3568 family protein [Thermosulfidibacteraceae bacterium]|jgi:hypothetical protein
MTIKSTRQKKKGQGSSKFLLLLILLTLGACTSYIIEDPYKAYQYNKLTGELKAVYPYDVGKVYSASIKAIELLRIRKLSSISDNLEGKIEGETALGKRVTIVVKSTGTNASTVFIRVGNFGNLEYSLEIKKEIDEVLGVKN